MGFMRWTLVLAVLAACGKSDPKTPPPEPPPKDEAKPPPPKIMAPATGADGNCTLTATGAVSADETTPAEAQAKYWMSDADKGSMEQPGFLVNCKGTKFRLSLVSSPNAAVEFKAKDYTVEGKNPDVSVLGRADKPLQNFTGKVSITAFDASHIAGSIDLAGSLQVGSGTVQIKGTFDVKCTHWGKCNH